ncbi:uncharacterized protein TNCV_114881 [Trichonephila clavipes]|nr:uncharacterized protein TNCV_114881 [Trichonephila clavipes]
MSSLVSSRQKGSRLLITIKKYDFVFAYTDGSFDETFSNGGSRVFMTTPNEATYQPAPHVVCSVYVEEVRQWFKGKKKSVRFAVPMIWKEPKNHSDDCYFCFCSVQDFNLKNRKDISYPTIIHSAIRPVHHRPDLPIPSPSDTLDNTLDDLDQISHISSDSDDG